MEIIGNYNKDCVIYNDNINEDELTMIYSLLNNKEMENSKIRIMPDQHLGNGCLIGFTSTITDSVNPQFVGVDIGCSITTCITDTKINTEELPLIEHRIKKEIPLGMSINDKKVFNEKDFYKFVNKELNKACSSWPEMIYNISFDENYVTNMLKRINMDEGVFYKSLCSLGGGNHFIEVGDINGNYAFTVHCGSRNLGVKVCKYWEKVASSAQIDNKLFKNQVDELKKKVKDKRTLPTLIKELKESFALKNSNNGYLKGDNLKGYITDMVIAQSYAKYNHLLICNKISDIFRKINNGKVIETIQSTHNYIDITGDHILRKGSIRAYKDEKIIIPFNMRDGLAICVGKSNEDWNCSAPHGAGRKLSRSKAKQSLTMEEFTNEMKDIYSTSVCESTIDESPMAYKDTNEIIKFIQETCDIICFVKPIINIKSTNG